MTRSNMIQQQQQQQHEITTTAQRDNNKSMRQQQKQHETTTTAKRNDNKSMRQNISSSLSQNENSKAPHKNPSNNTTKESRGKHETPQFYQPFSVVRPSEPSPGRSSALSISSIAFRQLTKRTVVFSSIWDRDCEANVLCVMGFPGGGFNAQESRWSGNSRLFSSPDKRVCDRNLRKPYLSKESYTYERRRSTSSGPDSKSTLLTMTTI